MGSRMVADLGYLVAAVCFVLALKGLSSPRTARRGNLVGAVGALIGLSVVLITEELANLPLILAAVGVGVMLGVPAARRVEMTAMPQLVALFNGVGGGAAAIVAALELPAADRVGVAAALFTVIVGSVSLSGSLVTFAKLQELMTTRPVVFAGGPVLFGSVLCAAIVLAGVVLALDVGHRAGAGTTGVVVGLTVGVAVLGLLAGVLFVLPVGGADVPVVISLLNAFTGLCVAASGYVLGNTLLLVAGTLVGASGTILTRLMATAMGRPLTATLFGAFTAAPTTEDGAGQDRAVRSGSPEDVAILLGYARTVVIVPGYGLAVAQAQHTIRELVTLLEGRGVEVAYGIHPVAGRMPGHMNVLLAEANVPYDQLREMEEVNPMLPSTDVALVVGANDVVNPAARDSPCSPIYGMPILDVDTARHVVFLKRSMRPGFAGIDNTLLYGPRTTMLFGDAKTSLSAVVAALKTL
jgi:H+-translocating NAD(P) transhydrogenase subunit beta